MKLIRLTLSALFGLFFFTANAAKPQAIRLTGTAREPITVAVGQSGRTETINSLPYTLMVAKEDLPIKLKFESEHYLYYDIDVPVKPLDATGFVYLVKVDESAMAMRSTNGQQAQPYVTPTANQPVVAHTPKKQSKGFDSSHGVNAAPLTGNKSENTLVAIIANEEYDLAANVDNATSDGLAFKEYCIRTLGVPEDNVRYMANLSFGRMKKGLNDILELADMLNGEANLILYYAGHGIPDNKTKDAFLMPVDADGTDTSLCLSLTDLYSNINSKNLNRCIVFLDACFSGAQRGGDMIVAARGVKLKPKEAAPEGKTIVFTATSDDQAAFSHKEENHGLFTYFLLKKLQESKGKVSLGELADYLSQKVGFESRRINNAPQTPSVLVAAGIVDNWKKMQIAE
ncbi:MAG: caspase family protein [Alistipes sp.]|nr:caspase family protein [Alistipes sp.]